MFFNLFKKKKIVAEPEKNNLVENQPVVLQEEQHVVQPINRPPAVEVKEEPAVVIAEKEEKKDEVKKIEKPALEVKNDIVWPKAHTNAAWLIRSKAYFVYADANFLRSEGAKSFIEEWLAEKQRMNLRKALFIPQFEIDILTDEEKKRVEQLLSAFTIRSNQSNYDELFAAISNLNWNIVFLTGRECNYDMINKAAAKEKVNMKLFSVAENGKIYPFEPMVNPFDTPMKMAKIKKAGAGPTKVPASGDLVLSDDGVQFTIGQSVMSNTTSITYETNDTAYFAKIYTPAFLASTYAEQKCRLMLSRRIKIPGVCWPEAALKDQNGVFVGILVPKAEGFPLRDALLRESVVRKYFHDWNKQDMAELALTILNMINSLQKWNVFFGCMNLSTFLVKDKKQVYFIDMDGWQIDGYPVLFENKLFDPPELQGVQRSLHFYKQDELNYQIAYLLFMLMMPGRMPYSQQNGETIIESIKNKRFSFGLGAGMRSDIKQDSVAGFWRFVWDHVEYNMAKNFYQSFAHDGEASKPGKRYAIAKWIGDTGKYVEYLNNPYDPESCKIYPKTFRRDENRTFIKCSYCKMEHPSFYFRTHMTRKDEPPVPLEKIIGERKICKTCYYESAELYYPNDPKNYFICEGCGAKIYYTNAARFMHLYMEKTGRWKPQKWCADCKEVYETRKCDDCGCNFNVTVGQYLSFPRKGYELPKRCGTCQRKKREASTNTYNGKGRHWK